jgi:hypothetical protein
VRLGKEGGRDRFEEAVEIEEVCCVTFVGLDLEVGAP